MISVVIPCYNLERYIEKTIKSIVNQSYKEWEIIIVDDGSTDKSYNVCSNYVKMYPNKVKLISQENQGVSVARNTGLIESKGEYICFLDGDDFLELDCFRRVIDKFEANSDLDICAYGYQDIDELGNISGEYNKTRVFPDKPLRGEEAFFLKCNREIWICMGSCVFRTSLIKDNNIYFRRCYRYGEDMNFINACLSYANEIEYINENYINCLARVGSATRSGINSGYIHASQLNRILYNQISERTDLSKEDKEKMLLACNIDYINVTTAAAKNIVENIGGFSFLKARRLYKEFDIIPEKIKLNELKPYISKYKELEWSLFYNFKELFFCSVKIYKKLRGEK